MHALSEGPGMILNWIKINQHTISYTHPYQRDSLFPNSNQFDLLLIMGGAMGVYETDRYPWLEDEIKWISGVLQTQIPVLGICLGSQLLARSLGCRVYSTGAKEIGWFPIEYSSCGQSLNWYSNALSQLNVFHWHGDTFDLPSGTETLATSYKTTNQAFLWNDRVLGLQYHLEIDEPLVRVFLETGLEEVLSSTGVQSPEDMIGLSYNSEQTEKTLFRILDHLISLVE